MKHFEQRQRTVALRALLWLWAALAALPALADLDQDILDVQTRWAEAKYHTAGDEQRKALEQLAQAADSVAQRYPERADGWIWAGIVKSTYAGAKGGLGALGLAKAAKQDFERAIGIDGRAQAGAAYTSLGSLYYQVPGWPVGFGDDGKARDNLRKGLEVAPDDIDANYFYADFLRDQGEYAEAKRYAERALAAPARPQRPLADEGRHREIRQLLEQIDAKLK